jgi:hypothetical protein
MESEPFIGSPHPGRFLRHPYHSRLPHQARICLELQTEFTQRPPSSVSLPRQWSRARLLDLEHWQSFFVLPNL